MFGSFRPAFRFALAVIEVLTLKTRLVRHPDVTAAHTGRHLLDSDFPADGENW